MTTGVEESKLHTGPAVTPEASFEYRQRSDVVRLPPSHLSFEVTDRSGSSESSGIGQHSLQQVQDVCAKPQQSVGSKSAEELHYLGNKKSVLNESKEWSDGSVKPMHLEDQGDAKDTQLPSPTDDPNATSANLLKLKIRRDSRGQGELSVITSPPRDGERPGPKTDPLPAVGMVYEPLTEPCRPQDDTPSPGFSKAKLVSTNRAKTKGELKKQLLERRELRLRGDGSSQASSPAGSNFTLSPARSHSEALSPLSVHTEGGLSVTPQPSPVTAMVNAAVAQKNENAAQTKIAAVSVFFSSSKLGCWSFNQVI